MLEDYGRMSVADQVAVQYRLELSKRQQFDENIRRILDLPVEVDDASVLVEVSAVKHAADLWRAHQRRMR